jgi:hypothetical protein
VLQCEICNSIGLGRVWPRAGAEVFILAHGLSSSSDRESERSWIDFGVAPSAEHVRAIFGLTLRQSCDVAITAPAG